MEELLKKKAESCVRNFDSLHCQVKDSIGAKKGMEAMRLLEQCQSCAQELADLVETEAKKDSQVIPVLEDYCELVYLINEELWRGERVNPGKVYRYMNKCLTMMRETLGLEALIEKGAQEEKENGEEQVENKADGHGCNAGIAAHHRRFGSGDL